MHVLKSIFLSADALGKCVQALGSLLVTVVDTKGTLGRSLLKALEDFLTSLSSMPDVQQIGRYATTDMHLSQSILSADCEVWVLTPPQSWVIACT